ncbi:unnamed protein product [Closterium sp. Naga37s-1]|nr:unnamed protein product [Closterium sp. Naga37s-1]
MQAKCTAYDACGHLSGVRWLGAGAARLPFPHTAFVPSLSPPSSSSAPSPLLPSYLLPCLPLRPSVFSSLALAYPLVSLSSASQPPASHPPASRPFSAHLPAPLPCFPPPPLPSPFSRPPIPPSSPPFPDPTLPSSLLAPSLPSTLCEPSLTSPLSDPTLLSPCPTTAPAHLLYASYAPPIPCLHASHHRLAPISRIPQTTAMDKNMPPTLLGSCAPAQPPSPPASVPFIPPLAPLYPLPSQSPPWAPINPSSHPLHVLSPLPSLPPFRTPPPALLLCLLIPLLPPLAPCPSLLALSALPLPLTCRPICADSRGGAHAARVVAARVSAAVPACTPVPFQVLRGLACLPYPPLPLLLAPLLSRLPVIANRFLSLSFSTVAFSP